MSEHVKQTIADLQDELRQQEQSVIETKRLINTLCKRAGMDPIYGDAELAISSGPSLSIRGDQFYGQPLATCIREILEMRKALNQGPATVNEIYDALATGGFKFETKNEDNAKRGLRISLTKNTSIFHKLPTGKFGLLEWYPNAKAAKPKDDGDDDDDQPEQESTS
jgi:hypothetical protein